MTLNVYISGRIAQEKLTELRAKRPEINFRFFDDDDELERAIGEADIFAGQITPRALANGTKLQWIHTWAAGPDRSLFPEMIASPIPLTSSKGNGAIPLAEHSLLLMLMLGGGAVQWIDAQRARRWESHSHNELHGLTCGIVGLGNSGIDLGRKLKAFDMVTLGIRRTTQPAPYIDEIYTHDDLEGFIRRCDYIVVTAPLTEETEGMFGEEQFRQMKPTAFFICISRGGIADDDALLKALEEGWIGGGGIDAHGVEPLPAESPFWTAPNTIVTPHNGSSSPMTIIRGFEIFKENLRRFLAGEPFHNLVDKSAGY